MTAQSSFLANGVVFGGKVTHMSDFDQTAICLFGTLLISPIPVGFDQLAIAVGGKSDDQAPEATAKKSGWLNLWPARA